MRRNNFNYDAHDDWRARPANLDRFGFEVLPGDARDLDDDELSGVKLFKTVLSLIVIAAVYYLGLNVYERLESFSLTTLFEKKIEEPAVEIETQPLTPIIDEALMAPGGGMEIESAPPQQPQKRLFNPDGTMRASFPMPPDSPPEDYYVPGQEASPAAPPKARAQSSFDPEREAYDPSSESSAPSRSSARVRRSAPPRSIGEYEVFDPERDVVKSDWDYFDDPRR